MCGIAGIFNLVKGKTISERMLDEFNDSLKERGPDQSGTVISEEFGLTHRRLSIIAPGNGKQPIREQDFYMVYNGEMYNYKDLNGELAAAGVEVFTDSDTETVIKFIKKFGVHSIRKFDGMFAFAITTSQRLILARDHVGKKPLFYTIKDGQLFFSSSLKSLLPISGKELDYTTLIYSMMYGNLTFKDRTIYKNIKTVEAGSFMIFDNQDQSNRALKIKYWDLDINEKYYNLSFTDAKEKLAELMDEAVRKRLVADVPLGSYLSGGLDSTIIAFVAGKYKEQLNTYSICYDDEITGENTYAALASQHLNTIHHSITPDPASLITDMNSLLHVKGAPLSTPNEVPIYLLAQEASKKLKVVLSGEGADELFNGYGAVSRAPFDLLRYLNRDLLKNPIEFDKSLLRLYGTKDFVSYNSHFQIFFRRMQSFDLIQLLNPEIDILKCIREIDTYFEEKFEKYKGYSLYTSYSAVVFEHNLRALLERLDFNTMHASLEARAPFLDKKIIDFAFNIPLSYKLNLNQKSDCLCNYNSAEVSAKFDTTKYILREAYKDKIPSQIITRPKQSFPVPYNDLYNSEYKLNLRDRLKLNEHSFFNSQAVLDWFDNYSGTNSKFKLWIADNYQKFIEMIN